MNGSRIFSDQLLEAVINDLDDQGIDPTQLQIVCDFLWEQWETTRSPLLIETYHQAGRRGGILSQYLQTFLEHRFQPRQRPLSRAVLVSLLSGRPKTRAELAQSLGDTPELAQVLNDLEGLDLICAEAHPTGDKRYILAHRYLKTIIEMDAASVERIQAEELLETALREFKLHRFSLAEHDYQFIKRQVDNGGLVILPAARELWERSRRASALRHLMFREVLTILLGMLVAIPVLGFNMLIYPPSATRAGIYAFTAFAAALVGAFSNALGAATLTWFDFRFPHWSRRRRFWLFLIIQSLPGIFLGILLLLIYATPWYSFVWPGDAVGEALLLSLFIGAALFLSWPAAPFRRWRDHMRPSLMVGPVAGLLLAAIFLLASKLSGANVTDFQQKILWLEFAVYLTTMTATFVFGLGMADRLLLGTPPAARQQAL
jgi:hypothetical protein